MTTKTYLEPEEIQRLEQAAGNLRDRLLIHILYHLGCRISEALGIAVEDIDLENGTITIQHLKTRLRLSCPQCSSRLGRRHTYCPGCGVKVADAVEEAKEHRRQRILPIDADTLKMLIAYIKRGGPLNRNGKNLIFGINRHRAWQVVRKCADKAELPRLVNSDTGKKHGISPHRLRDAFAVHAMKIDNSGDGQRMLQQHLGHQNFNTTAKYRKISGEEHSDWYKRLWENQNG